MLSFRRFFSNKSQSSFARQTLAGVSKIIATASCKGGVGKSTVAVNLASSLNKLNSKIGLFDADVFGPSIPTMTKTKTEFLQANSEADFIPIFSNNIQTVSVGNALDPESAILWKGPMINNLIVQLLSKAKWTNLDYLILDTPPGTGDVQMALESTIKIDGVVLVSSPQSVSSEEVARSIDMYQQWKIPILGIVQNFDGYVCENCKTLTRIFPGNGAKIISEKYGIDFLGSIPIDPLISKSCDEGVSVIEKYPESEYSKTFLSIAKTILQKIPIQKK